MRNSLREIELRTFQNEEVMNAVTEYFDGKRAAYYRDGIFKSFHRWEKCIILNGDCVEK